MVAVNADWLVESLDGTSSVLSKEWVGLVLLPTVGSIAGKSTYSVTTAPLDGNTPHLV